MLLLSLSVDYLPLLLSTAFASVKMFTASVAVIRRIVTSPEELSAILDIYNTNTVQGCG